MPKFRSVKEEADFWDTHSPLDYAEVFEEVDDVQFVRPPKEVLAIRIDKSTIDLIRRIARTLGVPHTTLARNWLAERVAAETRSVKRSVKKRTSSSSRAA